MWNSSANLKKTQIELQIGVGLIIQFKIHLRDIRNLTGGVGVVVLWRFMSQAISWLGAVAS